MRHLFTLPAWVPRLTVVRSRDLWRMSRIMIGEARNANTLARLLNRSYWKNEELKAQVAQAEQVMTALYGCVENQVLGPDLRKALGMFDEYKLNHGKDSRK